MTGQTISVIVPIFQVKPYLAQCIDSILCQTYSELEVILVDDGSSDGGGELCDRYAEADHRVRVIHQPNRGLSNARNAGIRAASGGFLAFVDGDDWLYPDHLGILYAALEKEKAGIAIGSFLKIQSETEPVIHKAEARIEVLSPVDALRRMVETEPIRLATACWKLYDRSLWEGVEFPERRRHEDEYTVHKVYMKANRIVITDSALYAYRQRPDSIMSSKSPQHALDKIDAVLARIRDTRELKDPILEDLLWTKVWGLTQCYLMESALSAVWKENLWLRLKALSLVLQIKAARRAGYQALFRTALLVAIPAPALRLKRRLWPPAASEEPAVIEPI